VHQQKLGWTKFERSTNPEQKLDNLLSQELASKIMGSNLRDNGSEVGLELRGNTAAITAILLLTKTRLRFDQSEILVAGSWDNKSSSFCSGFEIRSN
jgi:hypothetical protein